jgi:hypothetical protein
MKLIPIELSGGCQCGAVRYRTSVIANNAHICHCRMCQKAVGNLFAALVGVPREALHWTRGTPARFASSEHVDRGFCSKCGTPLFYENRAGDNVTITIGSLDHPELVEPIHQDGVESRQPYFARLHAIADESRTEDDSEEWAAAIRKSSNQHPDYDTAAWPAKSKA